MNLTAVFPQIKRGSIRKKQLLCFPTMPSKQFVFHGCCPPSLGPGHPAEMHRSRHIHKQVCFIADSSSWPYITTNDFWGTFTPPNTKITDWLLYPSPVSWSSALPVIPGFCHHWGNPVKSNPNQLELDQVEAESSNKTQYGCSPGNQGLCISTHLLCPTLRLKTESAQTLWPLFATAKPALSPNHLCTLSV